MDQMTHFLPTAILRMVKPMDHFRVVTQKVQMVPERKYHWEHG
jgi:hypothetical protein